MRVHSSSPLYRASRFYVGSNPRRRQVWTRYQTAPAVAAGYALLAFFLMTVGMVVLATALRLSHAGFRHIVMGVASFLRHLNY